MNFEIAIASQNPSAANEISTGYAMEEVISFSLRSLNDLRVAVVNIRLKTLTAET